MKRKKNKDIYITFHLPLLSLLRWSEISMELVTVRYLSMVFLACVACWCGWCSFSCITIRQFQSDALAFSWHAHKRISFRKLCDCVCFCLIECERVRSAFLCLLPLFSIPFQQSFQRSNLWLSTKLVRGGQRSIEKAAKNNVLYAVDNFQWGGMFVVFECVWCLTTMICQSDLCHIHS